MFNFFEDTRIEDMPSAKVKLDNIVIIEARRLDQTILEIRQDMNNICSESYSKIINSL